ncbi:DoxX family protein [Rufibacter hautae]|uniref:DoxX family membrane protein n=1 Tax=Rufibacter hautae TaxID=2595005 RepID=A0A5B6TLD0_9BACT|nr:DoxX family protein [Rufibacter hautae]KAA3440197.1 DoxX family membrane protein [Rufibacter hautae]
MKRKILTGFCILLGLLLINGGLNKFLNYMPVPNDLPEPLMKDTAALAEISWLIPLIGLAEVLGGILIIFPRTRALGALIVFPVMVGILLTHLFVDTSGLPIAIVIWLILLWVIFENRKRYLPLINQA